MLGALVIVAGGGGAIAATQFSPQSESEAIIEDAAKQLGVEPEELNVALRQAFEHGLDEAVENGRLTEEQAERLKQRLAADVVPLFRRAFLPPRLHRHGPRLFASLDAAATYLGLTEAALRARLRDGKTLAEIAREQGKSVDGLVDALVAEKTKRLDEAVEEGRLTQPQRDRIVANLREHVTEMANGRLPSVRYGRLFRGPRPFGRGPLLPPREDASSGLRPILPPVA